MVLPTVREDSRTWLTTVTNTGQPCPAVTGADGTRAPTLVPCRWNCWGSHWCTGLGKVSQTRLDVTCRLSAVRFGVGSGSFVLDLNPHLRFGAASCWTWTRTYRFGFGRSRFGFEPGCTGFGTTKSVINDVLYRIARKKVLRVV
jgi:hypothetical protein